MKIFTLKSMVLMLALVLGAIHVTAQVTTLYQRNAETPWSETDLSEWPVNYGTTVIDGGLQYTSPNNGTGEAVKSLVTTDNAKIHFVAKWNTGASTGRSGNYNYLTIGGVEFRAYGQDSKATIALNGSETVLASVSRKTARNNEIWDIDLTINKATGDVSYTVKMSASGEKSGTGILTDTKIENVKLGFVKGGRTTTSNSILQEISVTEEVQTVSTANYTVKFVDELGNEIKEAASYTGVVNNAIALAEGDKATFYTADRSKKYIYVSDDAADKTISADGSTVVTIKFHEAAKYAYTIKTSNGNTLSSGSNFEGEQIAVAYSAYELAGDKLYKRDAVNKDYHYSFTLSADNQTETLQYTEATEFNNVVFYKEAEQIDGLTATDGANANIRCSNGLGAYNNSEGNVKVVSLTAGNYKLTTAVWGNAGTDLVINCGNDAFTLQTQGYVVVGSKEFTLTSAQDIEIPVSGDANHCMDYIVIERTGDASAQVSIGDALYATFSSTNAVDFTGTDVKAYTATLSADKSKLELHEISVVPANTGVILKAAKGDYQVKIVENASTVVDNILLSTASGAVVAGDNYLGLGNKAQGVGFYAIANGVEIPQGRAYLVMPSESKSFIGFDENTVTGIQQATNMAKDGAVYTLMGTRVSKVYNKGIYIKNGKKIVVNK